MTRDQATELLRQYHKAHSARDLDALMRLYAEDAIVFSPIFKTLSGRAAIRQSFEAFFRLAPDYSIFPEEPPFIHEGDRVAEVSTASATYSDVLFGLAPTGHRIEYQIVRLLTFRDGQIVVEQRLYDLAGVLDRIEKSRVDDELKVASDIQRTLLARTRHVGAHFEAVGRSRPSRAIGGDFFEYGDWSSGAFGLALGDVSGKGPGAALLAAMLQGMFSMEADADHSPSASLVRMNRALVSRRIEPRFATVFYGVLAPDGNMAYSSAGHMPPLVVRRGGDVGRLSTGGPMMGVFAGAAFPDHACRLEPGDSILAFSDGVTEATRLDGAEFGEDRLVAAARANRALAPTALVDAVFTAVRDFAGDVAPRDDITVAVVRML